MTTKFFRASPYADDAMNLPRDIDAAIPFYESKMGFRVASRSDEGCRKAVLERDTIQIGLAENGGDPAQEGCFFEVDDVEAAVSKQIFKYKNMVTQPISCSSSSHPTVCAIALVKRSRDQGIKVQDSEINFRTQAQFDGAT